MEKSFFLINRPFSAFLAIFSLTILVASCSNEPEPVKNIHHDWINFSIKFKPNTSEATRDAAIKAMEKMMMDTLNGLRKAKYVNFNPSVSITKGLYKDSLRYNFSVGTRNEWGEWQNMADTSDVNDPKCPCKNGCRLCAMFTEAVFMVPDGADTNRVPVSAYIEFLNPKE